MYNGKFADFYGECHKYIGDNSRVLEGTNVLPIGR
jgi:hypothetical protein